MRYTVRRIAATALAAVDFSKAEEGRIGCVRPESSDAIPEVRFFVLHDGASLYVHFDVRNDRVVKVTHVGYLADVWKDSCCEFFVKPKADKGYFNFEMNAGGSLLLSYVEDSSRSPAGNLKKCTKVPKEWGGHIEILHSLPERVDPETAEHTHWELSYKVPIALLEHYVGSIAQTEKLWHANFYTCGDELSKPRWMTWSPVPVLNFHLPDCFGELLLA